MGPAGTMSRIAPVGNRQGPASLWLGLPKTMGEWARQKVKTRPFFGLHTPVLVIVRLHVLQMDIVSV